jgi:hypothetical protein
MSSCRSSKNVNALGSIPHEISETKLCRYVERLGHHVRIQELHHSSSWLLLLRVSDSAHPKCASQRERQRSRLPTMSADATQKLVAPTAHKPRHVGDAKWRRTGRQWVKVRKALSEQI